MSSIENGTSVSNLVNEAALIATFYCQRCDLGRLPLVARLTSTLQLNEIATNQWRNPNTKTFLHCYNFGGPANYDTTIVQLALNAQDTHKVAYQAWTELRDQLKAILDDAILKGTLGYSLIYQATTNATNDEFTGLTWHTLLPIDKSTEPAKNSKMLHLSFSQALQPLAETKMQGGRLWLVNIPFKHKETLAEGLQAAAIYVAVSPKDKNDPFLKDVLYGPKASLLMPDLIAHKGFHQIRQYKTIEGQYSDKVSERLRKSLKDIVSERQEKEQQKAALKKLHEDCLMLREWVTQIEALNISLKIQLFNYRLQQKWPTDNKVLQFHYAHLEISSEEMKLKIEEGQSVLQSADTAVRIIQSKLEIQRQEQWGWIETQRNRIETILAIMTVALGVPQFLSQDFIKHFIQNYLSTDFKVSIQSFLADYLGISITSCSTDTVCLTGVQLTITALIGLVVYWRFHSK